MKTKIELKAEFDLSSFQELVKASKDLVSDQQFFQSLAQFQQIKNQLKELGEQLDEADREIKQAINDRAKATFGDNWQAIAGDNWKITRSWAGSLYEIDDPNQAQDFLKLEYKPDSKLIEEYIKAKSALPEGISRNPSRTEVIRINVNQA